MWFSTPSESGNYVITWLGVNNFKPQLVGEGQKVPIYTKNQLSIPSSFVNQFMTHKHIFGSFHVKSTNLSSGSRSTISEMPVILSLSLTY